MAFVTTGQEALALMDTAPVDVLITDMHMPGMSGADVIEQVHLRHPGTIRIILSGQADQALMMRCIPLAHRFLPKPCEPAEIARVMERVATIEYSLQLDRVRQVIARLTRIPSVPELYLKIIQVLQNPDAGIGEVADVVSQDPGTTAGLLRIVNSAYFGLARRITDAREAVRFLGVDMVRTLALAVGAFEQLSVGRLQNFVPDELWRHSMATASLARSIARVEGLGNREQDLFFVAGLLHDIGRLVIASSLSEDWQRIVEFAEANKCPADVAELATIQTTHAEIGGGLLGLWGLPTDLVDAVMHHHNPCAVAGSAQICAIAVHCADHLTGEREVDHGSFAPPALDLDCLRAAGFAERFKVWSRLAAEPECASRTPSEASG